jgi:uncharacterized protein
VDRTEAEGRQVWRSIKANTAGFSIGFMSESKPRKGGGRILTEIDLIEISVTAKPANASTRALSWKSAGTALSSDDLWLPRSGAQQKSAAPPSIETIEQDIERIAKASRPVRLESFEG